MSVENKEGGEVIVVKQIDKTVEWDIDEVVLIIEQAKDKMGQILSREMSRKIGQAVQEADNILTETHEEANKLKDTSVREGLDIVNRAHEEAGRIIENAKGKAEATVKEEAARIHVEVTYMQIPKALQTMVAPDDIFMTVDEAAQYLNISRSTLWGLLRSRKLSSATGVASGTMISRSEVEAYALNAALRGRPVDEEGSM